MIIRKKWTRRALLRGTGAGMALLPFLPPLHEEAQALPGGTPKRLFIFSTSGGQVLWEFYPQGPDLVGGQILQPLSEHAGDLVVIEGLTGAAAKDCTVSNNHICGFGTMLVGRPMLEEGFDVTYPGGFTENYGWPSGPSVDQYIAQRRLDDGMLFPSLEAGVMIDSYGSETGGPQWRMCYKDAAEPIPPDADPWALFERIFGDLDLDPSELQRLRDRQSNVLDYVWDDLKRVQQQLGAEDRQRLEAHLESVNELQDRLSQPLPTCEPELEFEGNPASWSNIPATIKAQLDVLAQAFTCDVTRIASLQIAGAGSLHNPWLGQTENQHYYEHESTRLADFNGTPNAADLALIDAHAWTASQLDYFVKLLKATPELDGAGTMFDNSTILWCTPFAEGNHGLDNIPYLLIGTGGAFETGVHLQCEGVAHNALLVTLCHAMGLDDVESFGTDAYGTGGLPGLVPVA